MKLKAVFFDFDGLIVDTETHEYEAWKSLFDRHGAELPLDDWSICIGTTDHHFDAVGYLEVRAGRPLDRSSLLSEHRELYYAGAFAANLMEGFLDRYEEAGRLGLLRAVVSSSTSDWVGRHLEARGLTGGFDLIQTSDDVRRTKPDPELYLTALGKLGLSPREAVAFEDSDHGVRAARAAGIQTYAVPNSVTRQFAFQEADGVLSSLADLRLADLMEDSGGRD